MAKIKSIIDSDLKTCLTDCVFSQLSDMDSITFISNPSKKAIKAYIEDSNLEKSKELWKNLLIDSICILKVNDDREKLYKDSKDNIANFPKLFEDIRKSSSYGISELSDYFDDFIEFESVLYGTDKHYRDHVGHVLHVWAIGIGLINEVELKINDGFILDDKTDFNFQLSENNQKIITKSELWSMWSIIALCHDLGYPIEKTSAINKQAKKIISHFGNMNFSELSYSFDIFNSFLVDKFLNIISSRVCEHEKKTQVQTKFRDKVSKSLEDYKHGIFSSLLIFKNITYFLETDYSISNQELEPEDLRQFYIRKEILRSISSHTCHKIYHIELNTLSFLLILCDELQEWNRPKFRDILENNNSNNSLSKVKLKRFEFEVGESSINQKIHIEFIYNHDFTEIDEKYIVFKKFKTMHNLLRSAKDDNKRSILFDWDIIFKNKKFNQNFNSSKNSFKQMNISSFDNSHEDWVLDKEYIDIYS